MDKNPGFRSHIIQIFYLHLSPTEPSIETTTVTAIACSENFHPLCTAPKK